MVWNTQQSEAASSVSFADNPPRPGEDGHTTGVYVT